jgi:hypothetical protein
VSLSLRWLSKNVRPEQRGQLIDWRGVPPALRGVATAVVRNPREAESLVAFYGSPNYQPTGGVVLLVPGQAPVYIAHVRKREDAADPVGLTAQQLQDIAAEMWWAVIAEVLASDGAGRFTMDEIRATPHQLLHRRLELNRLGRILADAQNKILYPERQAWQGPAKVTVVR